jgi:hypothetical protein
MKLQIAQNITPTKIFPPIGAFTNDSHGNLKRPYHIKPRMATFMLFRM